MLRDLLASLLASLLGAGRPRAPAPGVRAAVLALLAAGRGEEALAAAAGAVARSPRDAEAHLALAHAWHKLHQPARALESCEQAARLRPRDPAVHDLRGAALYALGRTDEAMQAYACALAQDGSYAPARYHRALLHLARGEFALGWPGYELRRTDPRSALHAGGEPPGPPYWEGSDLAGRSLLVRREQGLGDEIMFACLLPPLAAVAARVLLECDPRLRALFARSFPQVEVLGERLGDAAGRAELQAGAGSLARLFRRQLADFPAHAGYLRADPRAVESWRRRLSSLGDGLKIGLSWTGGTARTRQALRSIPLPEWQPLLATPGARFVSLQHTPEASRELEGLRARHGIDLAHWPEAIVDTDQTAALVSALDLVVSVCTSVVHLAGALGRPVWVLVPSVPEWRYGLAGASMPWYPTARLFRQAAGADWKPALAAVAAALRERAAAAQEAAR